MATRKRTPAPKVEKSSVRVVGNGFLQRKAKPGVKGVAVKSQMIRVDAGFGKWIRAQAKLYGGITEVTRRLYGKADVLAVMIQDQTPTE
jgi:hypothetical protein